MKDSVYDISDTDPIFGTIADLEEQFQKGHEKKHQDYFKYFIPNHKVQSHIQYEEHFIQANFIQYILLTLVQAHKIRFNASKCL